MRLGLDRHAIGRRLAAGILHSLRGGRVYSVGENPLSKRGIYLAAVMACGARAALSYRAGGDLGSAPCLMPPEVTVPEVCRAVPGVRIHRTRMLDHRTSPQ